MKELLKFLVNVTLRLASLGLFLLAAWNGIFVGNYLKGTFYMAFVIAVISYSYKRFAR